ncbi:hypothetical protein EYW49_14060 [Siculibacillus lacustris]|uniref:DUF995 domain-containing protein n=1 Tax=Siculibacillus lacustris TaxID=1549641 RepID=A0A4Q9VLQ5_9HYPH|nr:hypothetical protein [Siculibacillus lacustris]TBW36458.1 hypothetical protein EYW49_14060 [Siculibacillus lacustris]
MYCPTSAAGRLAAALALVLAATLPAAAQLKPVPTEHSGLPEKLSGEDIRRLWFDGQPFLSTGPDGTAYRMVFTADGKSARLAADAGKKAKPTIGFWRVIAEGYCSRWTGSNREKCFNVRKGQDGKDTVVRFGQQIVATWKRP